MRNLCRGPGTLWRSSLTSSQDLKLCDRGFLRYHAAVFSPTKLLPRLAPLAVLLVSSVCLGQGIKETSIPLGNALTHALELSSLTGANAVPFHLKVHLFESTNPPSDYRGEIEEYWVSPQQWRRSIDSPGFKQTLIVNGDQLSEQNTGDYYPLWLRRFITGIFDPVPNADQWNKLDAKIAQITLPTGQRSTACARVQLKYGADTAKSDIFGNVCFDDKGLLTLATWLGYGMQFHDYERFGKKKMIARRYQEDPESGTEIVANVVLLEELKRPDPSLFAITQPTSPAQRLESVEVSQSTIERAAEGQPSITWPAIGGGKTTGLVGVYISVGRDGRVREAYPLTADNGDLQDAARAQLRNWKLKPMVEDGKPVQAQAALSFHFDTMLSPNPAQATGEAVPAPVPEAPASSPAAGPKTGLVKGFLISQPAAVYPPEARKKHIKGKVVLAFRITTSGTTKDIRLLSSPDQSLTDSAIAAVSQWRYQPYLVNGVPMEVGTEVEINFQHP